MIFASQTWRIVMWGALAYFWSFINDSPINADGLLGHEGYYVMELLLNILSLSCFFLASREAIKGRSNPRVHLKVGLYIALAFLLSSADDIPFLAHRLGPLRTNFWYPFEIAIYGVSLVFFYLAVREWNAGVANATLSTN
jgi:hypothetical protein